jgi:aspartyl protease family protein
MATGFIPNFIAILLLLAALPAAAADVALVGVIGDKAAVLALDGGDPKTVKVGQKWNGISVISVDKERAVVEIDGKKRVLVRGQHYRSERSVAAGAGRQSVTLAADSSGHFVSEGAINGVPVRFLVDTGASLISIPASDAQRLGIDYRKGERGMAQTANGPVAIFRVRFDTVRVGSIELNAIDGIVIEQGLPVALLGMTFLNRVEMKRDGQTMVLIRRF